MVENDNDMFSAANSGADEELSPFDVRDSSGKAGLIKLALGFGFLLFLAFFVLKIYQPGVRDRDAPPKIIADNTPFKIEPEDVGGVQTPNQDKTVYEIMDGKKPDETVTPSQSAEVPIELPKAANIKVDPAPTITPKEPEPAPAPAPVIKAPDPVVKAPAQDYVKTPDPARPTVGNSEWVVQVASVRSEADANNIWNKTSSKFSDVLAAGHYADIKYADLAEKGIYYRLRVAGLGDKAAANELCSKFKARGQACFVTRK